MVKCLLEYRPDAEENILELPTFAVTRSTRVPQAIQSGRVLFPLRPYLPLNGQDPGWPAPQTLKRATNPFNSLAMPVS
ncbi:MAG: hypothetical protein G8237_01180 [Magnetococcales bacterium]|nr:hypothetical protein [Magnetococcales bacterium]NGZ04949.1 hypothetical protein [Magnetococcales bacterium]